MSNNAIITTEENYNNDGVGIYVHWNGDDIQYWLDQCNIKCYRKPEDDSYGWAYLVSEIANYFGNGLSVGIDKLSNLPNMLDNGIYIIKDWKVVRNINDESTWV